MTITCSRRTVGLDLPWCHKPLSWRQRHTRHAPSVLYSSYIEHEELRGITHPLPPSRSQFLALTGPIISSVQSSVLCDWTETRWESLGQSGWLPFVAKKMHSTMKAIIWPTWRTLRGSLLQLHSLTRQKFPLNLIGPKLDQTRLLVRGSISIRPAFGKPVRHCFGPVSHENWPTLTNQSNQSGMPAHHCLSLQTIDGQCHSVKAKLGRNIGRGAFYMNQSPLVGPSTVD